MNIVRFSRGLHTMLFVCPLLWISAVVVEVPAQGIGQHAAVQKLTLMQIEGLVSHGVPDSTLSSQVRIHGLAFTPTPTILEELQAKGAGPLTLAAIEKLSSKSAPGTVAMLKPTDYVSDFAHVLGPRAVEEIDRVCAQLDHSNADVQIALVTIPSLNGEDIGEYAKDLGNAWGVGRKESNRGVLVLLAIKDHKWRIEVGYGLEGTLSNSKAESIGKEMLPQLRENDFDGALILVVHEIAQTVTGEAGRPF